MRLFQKFYLQFILWACPFPARIGWGLTVLGDATLETAGKAGMDALRGLGRLESEGRRDLDRVRVVKLNPGTCSRVFFNKRGEQVR